MCRKRTLGEVAGERIVCDENFACLTILAPALSDRAISGGKHMIFQHINNIHLARLDLNEPVCILIPKVVVIADNISKFGDVPKLQISENYRMKNSRQYVSVMSQRVLRSLLDPLANKRPKRATYRVYISVIGSCAMSFLYCISEL